MLIESSTIEANSTVPSDICIVGSGPAGISLAKRLSESGKKIVILEAGGLDYEESVSDAYKGITTGATRMQGDSYLGFSRQRFLGGTSNHWSGWCCRMEPIDFEKREWVPNSGWPISYNDIEPYYQDAEKLLGLQHPDDYTYKPSQRIDSNSSVVTKFYEIKAKKFKSEAIKLFSDSKNVDLLLHSPVIKLVSEEGGDKIKKVIVKRSADTEFSVSAKNVVMACGGVENARLLLSSNHLQKKDFANDYDQVGRYFQEHPHFYLGYILTASGSDRLSAYDLTIDEKNKSKLLGVLAATEEAQKKNRFYNAVVQLKEKQINGNDDLLLALEDTTSQFSSSEETKGNHFYSLYMRAEMAPNADNKVSLDTSNFDAHGSPRANLHVSVSSKEVQAYSQFGDFLAQHIGASHKGRLKIMLDSFKPESSLSGGYHHMGTTRMHSEPRFGVVDANCKAHGASNLYFAGSSVFTTSGYANPTLTIVALALRLADYLKKLGA